ncbi:MAG: hypothetical protein COA78_15810 [Blastopirellula sp.]|nr:MAG: hypothetical protein COA78_15810 [Blastopirellula sp.]
MDDIFAEANKREEQLYDELAACPVSELTGIVSPSGVGGAKSGDQELWSLLLDFDAWCVGSEPIRMESLTLRRKVSDEELDRFQELIEEETIIRVRARVAEDNIFGSPQGQLEEFIELDSKNSVLQAYLVKLQKPVTHQDKRFGTLTNDREINWYSVEVEWNGDTVNMNLIAEESDELTAALKIAYSLWDNESTWHERIVDYAVQELLPLKNDNWLGDEETEFSPTEFKRKMTLESISIYPDGDFEFWHNDGDLFWGHSIQISGNLSDGLTNADIPG